MTHFEKVFEDCKRPFNSKFHKQWDDRSDTYLMYVQTMCLAEIADELKKLNDGNNRPDNRPPDKK